jgi:tetratricopeptide (TPR) repeat protein
MTAEPSEGRKESSQEIVRGNPKREAVDSLRGYTYQIMAATLAWIELSTDSVLLLEVAEDFATLANDVLTAVQVKDTAQSGTITINSEGVKEAITAFVELATKNPNAKVSLRYLTTSEIGKEKNNSDRVNGQAFLKHWRIAASGGDVAPIKEKLLSHDFPDVVHQFIGEKVDEEIRNALLRRIHWIAGQPKYDELREEIEQRLVVLGRDKFNLNSGQSKKLISRLLHETLNRCINKDYKQRQLGLSDLYQVIDNETLVSVSAADARILQNVGLQNLAAALAGQNNSGKSVATEEDYFIRGNELPSSTSFVQRNDLKQKAATTLLEQGVLFLAGASGLGKSLLAREVARSVSQDFAVLDLRGVEEEALLTRLAKYSIHAFQYDHRTLILDDLNCFESSSVRARISSLLSRLSRSDRLTIFTCYRPPPISTLTSLGIEGDPILNLPYLSEKETEKLVELNGGDPIYWGKIAYHSGGQGHPQLTHAFVRGMATSHWPKTRFKAIVSSGFSSEDIDAERDAARRGLTTAFPEATRKLLYRLSLIIGRFDRQTAISLGEVAPKIDNAAERFDVLNGPWIESFGAKKFRVSPLAATAGTNMLTKQEVVAIHTAMAEHRLSVKSIRIPDLESAFGHALAASSESHLVQIANLIVIANQDVTKALSDQFMLLQVLRTDASVFNNSDTVNILLRLAQFKLLAAGTKPSDARECCSALLRELSLIKDPRSREITEIAVLAQIVCTMGAASIVPNWIHHLEAFRKKCETEPMLQGLSIFSEVSSDWPGTAFEMMFTIGTAKINSVSSLEEVFVGLDRIGKEARSVWLGTESKVARDFSILVNGPWASESQLEVLNTSDALLRYERMRQMSISWDQLPLAVSCAAAQMALYDEHMKNPKEAYRIYEEMEAVYGELPLLLRAKAKVLSREGRNIEACDIYRQNLERIGTASTIDRAFALRDAAICAAEIEDWVQALEWFSNAKLAAEKADTSDMEVMAVGLLGDAAVANTKIGNYNDAVKCMLECLLLLKNKIDAASSLNAGYCHRIARHATLWMVSVIEEENIQLGSQAAGMLPGACSNYTPHRDAISRPLGHIDVTIYQLAGIEAFLGIDVGLASALAANSSMGVIPQFEYMLAGQTMISAVRRLDTDYFAKNFESYLTISEYTRQHSSHFKSSLDLFDPKRVPKSVLAIKDFDSDEVISLAEDAIVAFGLIAVFQSKCNLLITLQEKLASEIGADFVGCRVLKICRGQEIAGSDLYSQVASLVDLLVRDEQLVPDQVWIVGLRVFEWTQRSVFQKIGIQLLSKWLRTRWIEILEEQTFRLSAPSVTVPVISSALLYSNDDEAFLAGLLLASEGATKHSLSPEYRIQLKKLVGGGTQ